MVAAFYKFFGKIVQIIHLNTGKPNRNMWPSFQMWILFETKKIPESYSGFLALLCFVVAKANLFFLLSSSQAA